MQKPAAVVDSITMPPDGGWGWVIVIASGIASGFPAGFQRSVTIFYYELLNVFKQSATSTATVMSVDTVIGALTSPLAGALCNRFGCRLMAMMAGVLIALAFFTSAFVPTLFYFYFTFSILRGFGSTVFAVARISIINLYFDRNKGKANAVSAMFYSLGSVYMAPLITIFFAEYGLQGTLIICSALMLHIIPAAALFRPLPELQTVTMDSLEKVNDGCSGEKLIPRDIDKHENEEKVMKRDAVWLGKDDLEPECPDSLKSSDLNTSKTETDAGIAKIGEPEEPGSVVGFVGSRTKVLNQVDKPSRGNASVGVDSSHIENEVAESIKKMDVQSQQEGFRQRAIVEEKIIPQGKRVSETDTRRSTSNPLREATPANETILDCIEQDGSQLQEPQNGKSGKSLTTMEEITLLPPFPNITNDNDKTTLPEHSVQMTHNADMANEYCGTPVTTKCVVRQRSVLEQHPDPEVIKHQVRALTYMKNAFSMFTGGVLQDSNFLLYSLFMSSYAYTHSTTFTFLSGIALQKGCTIGQCTIAIAVMSGIEIPLRLSYGFFFDLKAVRPRRQFVFGTCGCCIGVLVFTMPLFPSHVMVLVIWAIQQAICGVIVCQWSTVMSDILPRAQLTSGFGVLRFIMGVGSLFAPLCGGATRDGSGSYSLVYFIAGAQLLISSMVLLIHNVRQRILERRQNASTA